MKKTKFYGKPYKSKKDIKYPTLEISALNSLAVYQNYKYFSSNILTHKIDYICQTYRGYEESFIEYLSRARRTILFTDITGLLPMPDGLKEFEKLNDLTRKYFSTDHTTNWISETGNLYYLNEPYDLDPVILNNCPLTYICIPTQVAPYCGLWSSNKECNPGSTSFLIGHKENLNELALIELKIHQAIIGKLHPYNSPLSNWNSLEDITNE